MRLNQKNEFILVGGDFNVNVLNNSSTTNLFNYFCDKLCLSRINNLLPTCYRSGNNPSLIDYFLISSDKSMLRFEQLLPSF